MTNPPGEAATGAARIHRLHVPFSVYYAVQEPAAGPSSAPPALLLVGHGYGQSCKGFIRAFEALRNHNVLVVAPQGPNQFYWHENGKVGFTWMTRYMRENTIPDLMEYMRLLMDELQRQYAFDPARIHALGFSQGSALAFRFGASGIVPVQGVMACGGDLPPDVAERLADITPFRAYIVHGRNDTSMSFDKAREGEEILRRHGYEIATHYFDGEHNLPDDINELIVNWIQPSE